MFLGGRIPQIYPSPRDEDCRRDEWSVWEFDVSNAEEPIECSLVDGVCTHNLRTPLAEPPSQGSYVHDDVPPKLCPTWELLLWKENIASEKVLRKMLHDVQINRRLQYGVPLNVISEL